MTDREKLVELLSDVQAGGVALDYEALKANAAQNEEVADYLLAHGVTVREMQRPLTVNETFGSRWSEPNLWIEMREKETLFLMNGDSFTNASYGKTWRCWAEKPTDEERRAAGWEK